MNNTVINKPLKFYLITDTHFFKNSLGAYGKEYDEFMRFEQKCFAETECINRAVFKYLEEAKDADIVLISGDLSFNGEKESHLTFIDLLKKLKQNGKKVYVVTADHDFKDGDQKAFAFNETGRITPEGTPRDELFDLYYEFGFKDALAVDEKHLSYVAQIGDGVRLLALNNDYGNDRKFDEEQRDWIKAQAQKAQEDGQLMFAMNHYPLLPGQPIFSVVPSAVQKDAGEVVTLLADNGVHLVFTGHMHNHSINEKTTKSGNKIFDVCTGSIIASPSVIRLVTVVDNNTVDIKTLPTPDFDWHELNGKSCTQYLDDLFDSMILNMISDMRYNPYNLLRRFGAGDKKKLYPIVKFVGKKLDKYTVGKVCHILMVKCDTEIKKMPVKYFVTELVRGVFAGDQMFKEGTPKGDALLRVFKRLNPILKKINLKNTDGNSIDLFDVLKNTAGNYGMSDYNAVLKLN